MACSIVAWIVMLTEGHGEHNWLCAIPRAGVADNMRLAWQSGVLTGLVAGWITMTVAMMPPLAIPLIRHVAARSYANRRHRAIAAFLAGVIGTWLFVGITGLLVVTCIPVASLNDPIVPDCGFILAAAWQLLPMKRAALLRCHRTVPLGPSGWRADRDCLHYGFAHSLVCIKSCWALMLAVSLAAHMPVDSIGVQAIALTEQRARRPRLALSALLLASAAVLMLCLPG